MSSGSGVAANARIAKNSDFLATFLKSSMFLLLAPLNFILKALPMRYIIDLPNVAPAAEQSTSTSLSASPLYIAAYPATTPKYGILTNGIALDNALIMKIPKGAAKVFFNNSIIPVTSIYFTKSYNSPEIFNEYWLCVMPKLVLLGEEVIECLNCGEKEFRVTIYIYEVPFFRNILIETGVCSKCGFRRTDVSVADVGKPKRIILKVKSDKELNALVLKSSTALLRIPELGIEVAPGPAAPGYITTVEGILHRVLEHVPAECFEENSKCHGKVREIMNAAEGKKQFTLIIEDYYGRSGIKGKDVEVVEEELR